MTSAAAKPRRSREIAQIHTLAKQLGLDEVTRRFRMERVGGARSAAELSDSGRRKVIDDLRLEIQGRARTKPQRPRHQRMIVGLWLEAFDKGVVTDKRDAAIDTFVERQTGISKLEWLSIDESPAVIEAIKSMIRREVDHG